jgi:uncharacterized NAD-dependent epimerase/dehydratase family protein
MSFGLTAAAWTAIAAGVGATYTVASGIDQSRKQGHAQDNARAAAKKQERDAQIANNMANRRKPNAAALVAAAMQAGGGGGSTLLTGPSGVDANGFIAKNTMLGG